MDGGTLGSNENVTIQIRKNDTTTTTGCTLEWNSATGTACNEAPAMSFSAGDYWTAQITTPVTWVTTPTNVYIQSTLYFSVP
jgi:hypothetical protein